MRSPTAEPSVSTSDDVICSSIANTERVFTLAPDPCYTPRMIDRVRYANAPLLSASEAVTLVEILAASVKETHPENLKAHAKYMAGLAAGMVVTQAAKDKATNATAPNEDEPTTVDMYADRAFKAIRTALEAWTLLHPSFEEPAEAQALIDRIFGEDGTEFLKLPYPSQLHQMNVHMIPIDGEGPTQEGREEGLAERIDTLLGPQFLTNVRARIVTYDKMVTATATAVDDSPALRPKVRVLQESIAHFATIVIGNVVRDDEASLAEAKVLLTPIDNARIKAAVQLRATRKAKAKSKVEAEPKATVPAAPAPAPAASSTVD